MSLAKQKGNQDIIRMLIQFGASEDR
ncbi:MAG: hypothetical protein ABW119_02040 [Candidatus Thiodiazotropha lotti]